jgi:hypothetical protein
VSPPSVPANSTFQRRHPRFKPIHRRTPTVARDCVKKIQNLCRLSLPRCLPRCSYWCQSSRCPVRFQDTVQREVLCPSAVRQTYAVPLKADISYICLVILINKDVWIRIRPEEHLSNKPPRAYVGPAVCRRQNGRCRRLRRSIGRSIRMARHLLPRLTW